MRTLKNAKVNLGCGRDTRKGWINIDQFPGVGVNIVMDLASEPLPFPDQSVDEVCASHVFEHLVQWEKVLLEIHRILKPGGVVEIRVPHADSMHSHTAYHVRQFKPYTMNTFIRSKVQGFQDMDHQSLEREQIFELVSCRVTHRLPLYWHIRHYLKVKPPQFFPIGVRDEIVWRLMKA